MGESECYRLYNQWEVRKGDGRDRVLQAVQSMGGKKRRWERVSVTGYTINGR